MYDRDVGVCVRGRLAKDVIRCTLFDVEKHQGQVRSTSVVRRHGGGRVRGLEQKFNVSIWTMTQSWIFVFDIVLCAYTVSSKCRHGGLE